MNAPIVELAGVRKSYGIGTSVVTEVLHGIDLRIDAGELVALVGPSGSGKSTLLNLIGLLERPSSGEIAISGRPVSALDEAQITELRGRTIGFVFQFHHLLPEFTALENVMMPAIIDRGIPDAEAARTAAELLSRVGLAGAERKRPGQLSGGMQQRVAIARALSLSPPLILADEPTGNLDTKTADDVFELLLEFNRTTRAACLIVTHDMRLAERCRRRIQIVDGRLVT
ncbi:MAG TPA: ABC transporter ATP-binding protein [Burkholderiaceae bacterium]|nr:ABC transporter ATP-binding protein [Burkholderiaceae bacterium]